ncbi:MAG: hypothetical protein RL095_2539 [Verrucomicrobiota bacterium]|jgi:cystathionine gamma-synthase
MPHLPQHFPVGQRIPGSQHSVVVSLPTMRSVIGYEERDAETMKEIRTGYPRFVLHPLVREAAAVAGVRLVLPEGRAVFPLCSARAAAAALNFSGAADAGINPVDGWFLLHIAESETEACARAAKYLQHTGHALSSRQAEDWLAAQGLGPVPAHEELFEGDSLAECRRALAPWLQPADESGIQITRAGMAAFSAAFEAACILQRRRRRRLWIQLGWLYLDTTEILKKFLGPDEEFIFLPDVHDQKSLEELLSRRGGELAGLVTEAPTNPLLQTADIPWLSALVRRHGGLAILDPSSAGLVSVDLLPWCDLLCASLTKYAGWRGSTMLGVAVVNPSSPDAAELAPLLAAAIEAPYRRDLDALAAQIGRMEEISLKAGGNALLLAEHLRRHPGVKKVFSPLAPGPSGDNYRRIARASQLPGSLVSIELACASDSGLNAAVASFYDRLPCAKGPSFGNDFTLVCPFIYLAHYDLVTNSAGRQHLRQRGLDPELMRISVGTEDFEQIRAAFDAALAPD